MLLRLSLAAFIALLLSAPTEAGRRRFTAPPPVIAYFPGDGDLVIREIIVEYQLGPGTWEPFLVIQEEECLRTYAWVGLRLRYCWAEDPTSCSDLAEWGVAAPCSAITDLL